MDIYVISITSCENFDEESYIEGAYFCKETAQLQFDILRKEARENWSEEGNTIETDSDNCFSAFGNVSTAKDYCYMVLKTVKIMSGFTALQKLQTLDNAICTLSGELGECAVRSVFGLLAHLKVSQLDFSVLEDSELSFTIHGKHNVYWNAYPKIVRRDEEKGTLVFECEYEEEPDRLYSLESSEIPDESLGDIARTLCAYFGKPEAASLHVEVKDGKAVLVNNSHIEKQ